MCEVSEKLPKLNYFREGKADPNDIFLQMCIKQGYVPKTCLLGGQLVFALVNDGKDPCEGCNCDRTKCNGRLK